MKVKVKALTSFAGIRISMHGGQEAELELPLAKRLEQCRYVAIIDQEQMEVEKKEGKRVNKRRSVAAS